MTHERRQPEFERLLRVPPQQPGLRLHRLQAVEPDPSRQQADAGGRASQGYTDYVDYLEVHPEEFGRLFDTILINVTAFFRDPTAWEASPTRCIPRILAGKRAEEPIRVWCAGCASGEEAYTLRCSLAEALGIERFRDRVKIYATDVDEEALLAARQAVYGPDEVQNVPPPICWRTTSRRTDGRYVFQKDLRRSVIFGRHDLIQDAPISRIDLLSCRNTLMYFNAETQARILERFHFALNERGFLFLGKAETLLTYSNAFIPIDLKRRIFAKVARDNLRDRLTGHRRGPAARRRSNHLVGARPDPRGGLRRQPRRPGRRRLRRARSPWPTSGPGSCSISPPATSAARSRTCSSPTGPPSSAPASTAPTPSAASRRPQGRRVVGNGPGESSYFDVHVVPLMDAGGLAAGREHQLPGHDRRPSGSPTSTSAPPASWRPPTRSSSRPTRSSRPPTRSSSRPTRSSRRPTRSSSPPTRSSRR